MANIFKIKIFILFILSITSQISCLPIPLNDLIDGNEFLSLFIEPSKNIKSIERYDDNHHSFNSPSSNKFDEDGLKESIISVESILTNDEEILLQDSSNYGLRLHNRNRKFISKSQKGSTSSTTSSYGENNKKNYMNTEDSSENFNPNNEKPRKQIIKMVTSGSKIIFLEEVTPKENLSKNLTFSSKTQFPESERSDLNSTSSEDIQVLSISVSSTIGKTHHNNTTAKQQNHIKIRHHELVHFQPLENVENNNNPPEDDEKSDFINRSHKSEFSIEEIEPVTQESTRDSSSGNVPAAVAVALAVDSVNSESTNLHRIVAPTVNPINQSKHQKNITNINSSLHIQRRQDKLLPFQTVIYHDSGYSKDGNAQPRSVSYSSVAQSVDEINSWKELDSLIKVRQSVNESLHNPNYSERIEVFGQKSSEKVYSEPGRVYSEPAKIYSEPSKIYSEPARTYSEPAKVYGEPEKQYGEPSKIYSEPSKVYSEPAKVYSEPAKVYGEPSKVYWPRTTSATTPIPIVLTTRRTTKNPNSRRVIFNLDKLPYDLLNAPQPNKQLLEHDPTRQQPHLVFGVPSKNSPNIGNHHHHYNPSSATRMNSQSITPTHSSHNNHYNFPSNHRNLVTDKPNISIASAITERSNSEDIYTPTPEQNYEIEESVSVMTNGKTHGIQSTQKGISTSSLPPLSSTIQTNSDDDDSKVGYVVEGRNYRKYRVEEKTSDGFIVGEYGVVSHNDGSLRGVRYTADSTINPSLIHEALMKFLSL